MVSTIAPFLPEAPLPQPRASRTATLLCGEIAAQEVGRGQSGQTAAQHRDIDIEILGQRRVLRRLTDRPKATVRLERQRLPPDPRRDPVEAQAPAIAAPPAIAELFRKRRRLEVVKSPEFLGRGERP